MSSSTDPSAADEGVLDRWVEEWLATNPHMPARDIYHLARGDIAAFPVTRDMASVEDETADGVPIRIYTPAGAHGLTVYFHGGAMCMGSVSIMDNVARELAHVCGTTVVSVEYRLAPEDPFPAGLDDCEAVTRWALRHSDRFGCSPGEVFVAGESAGGSMVAGVTLRLRDDPTAIARLAGQVLIYPGVAGNGEGMASRKDFAAYGMDADDAAWIWAAYSGGRHIDDDPYAVPLRAASLAGLPPALVVLGGCDFLRDEGRAYGQRMKEEGVDVTEICHPGQIHGFMNRMFPAAAAAYEQIGEWVRARLAAPV